MKWFRWLSIIAVILLGLLLLTGQMYHVYGWCEKHIGGWFVPVALGVLCLSIVVVPLGRGVLEGMKESTHTD